MAQIITNQASVSYNYNGLTGSALSNIASAVLTEPISASKLSVDSVYKAGEVLTYTISFVNKSAGELLAITINDNLGTYLIGTTEITPLTFVDPALLYVDGVFIEEITPTIAEHSIEFALASLAAGSNAHIIYRVRVNETAKLTAGSSITNTALIDATGLVEPLKVDNTVYVNSYADVRISKSMSPANVTDGSPMTYTFEVYNYGNAAATNIVISDAFVPAPENILVQRNASTIAQTEYSYTGGLLTLPSGGTLQLSLPAADFKQDTATGVVTIEPTSFVITVKGSL